MPKNSSGFTQILVILILLVLVGSGTYYFGTKNKQNVVSEVSTASPTVSTEPSSVPTIKPTDPIENWKTYNYQLFTIQLPPEFSPTSTKNPLQFLNYNPDPKQGGHFDSIADKGKLKIEIYQNSTSESLENYLERQKENTTTWQEEIIAMNGYSFVKVKTSNPGFVFYAKHISSDTIFSFAFGLDFKNHESLAEEILSTFKFTN